MDLSCQDIDNEVANFSSMYAPLKGLFLLAQEAAELTGGKGLRKLSQKICEMKRLFVYERFRNRHLAHALCTELIHAAVEAC
jgi:hypothetical protein